jgi:hypothetical protein
VADALKGSFDAIGVFVSSDADWVQVGFVSMSELQATEKLCVEGHNNSGEIHRQCAHTYRKVDSPSDKQPSSRGDGNYVIGRCP